MLLLSRCSKRNVTTKNALDCDPQHHYVERLHRLYLYCAPMVFSALWKLVVPFVDPVTKQKVRVTCTGVKGHCRSLHLSATVHL